MAEQLQRCAVGALDEALIVERHHPFTGRADELRTAVKPHQIKVLTGAEQGAVFDILGSHVDECQRVTLGVAGGSRDVERRQKFPAHVEDGGRGARQLRVLRQEMIRAVNHHGPTGRQAGPHAVGAHLPLAPHHSLAKAAAPGCGQEAGITEVVQDDPVAIGQHDAVLGVPR